MGDSLKFNPASHPQVRLGEPPSNSPKIGEHKSTPTAKVAVKTFVKGIQPETMASKDLPKIATHRPVSSFQKTMSLLQKTFPSIFKDKSVEPKLDLKKVPLEQRSTAAARHLIASFSRSGKDLTTEGVFRISGSGALVKSSKLSIEKGSMPEVSQLTSTNKAALISSLIGDVEFFDEEAKDTIHTLILPNLTELNESIKNSEENFWSEPTVIASLNTIIGKMPLEKKELLRDLVNLCDDIKEHSDTNKMTASNLAMVLGPRFLPFENNSAVKLLDQNAEQQKLGQFILGLSKENKQFLFT